MQPTVIVLLIVVIVLTVLLVTGCACTLRSSTSSLDLSPSGAEYDENKRTRIICRNYRGFDRQKAQRLCEAQGADKCLGFSDLGRRRWQVCKAMKAHRNTFLPKATTCPKYASRILEGQAACDACVTTCDACDVHHAQVTFTTNITASCRLVSVWVIHGAE